ncbi:MAG: hypothetical protein NTV94_13525 [Planctomycetota bacterium]|nr:hypothetical protein [Planctomycetota bacterium]
MRLLRKELYRAFPELDRFDDERCIRFVEAARGGFWSKLSAITLCALSSLLTLLASVFVADLLSPPSASADFGPVEIALILAGCMAAPLVALVVRDQLLRLRVNYLLACRGICLGCNYALIGLTADADGMVTCPECHRRSELDDAFSHLEGEEARRVHSSDARWRRRRIWLLMMLQHTCVVGIYSSLLLPALGFGLLEALIRLQPHRIDALCASIPTASDLSGRVSLDPGPDLWSIYSSTVLGVLPEPSPAVGSFDVIRWGALEAMPAEPTRQLATREREMLVAAKADGRVAALASLGVCQPRFLPESGGNGTIDTQTVSAHVSNLVNHAWLNEIRMYAAIESRDAGELANAVRVGLLIATALELRGRDGAWGQGKRIEYLTHAAVLAALESPSAREFVPSLSDIYSALPTGVPNAHVWQALQADSLEQICTRLASKSPGWRDYLSGKTRLGALTGPIEDFTRLMTNLSAVPAAQRRPSVSLQPPDSLADFFSDGSFVDTPEHCVSTADTTSLQLAGIRVWLALERYHQKRGEYPASLTEMEAERSTIDPLTGRPFDYRRIDGVQRFDTFDSTPGFLLSSRGGDDREDLLETSASLPPVRMLPRAGRYRPSLGVPKLTGPRDILINATN